MPYTQTPLQVVDGTLLNHKGSPASMKGMSLYWDIWGKHYWNTDTLALLKSWGAQLVRLPLGNDKFEGGYQTDLSGSLQRAIPLIQAALDKDLYVLVDCHDHDALKHPIEAQALLWKIAKHFPNHPGILYEVVNEPLNCSWGEILEYATEAIKHIRVYSPNAVCIVGTPHWSADLSGPLTAPVELPNVMYAYHFYSATHSDTERKKLEDALTQDLPVFISECGPSAADGNGTLAFQEFDAWLSLLESYRLSWCGWALNDKLELSSCFHPSPHVSTPSYELTDTGLFYRSRLCKDPLAPFRGAPRQVLFPSPFSANSIKENGLVKEYMSRTVPIPTVLLEKTFSALLENFNKQDLSLYLLWLAQNWNKIPKSTKEAIHRDVSTKRQDLQKRDSKDLERYWALFRLEESIRFLISGNNIRETHLPSPGALD